MPLLSSLIRNLMPLAIAGGIGASALQPAPALAQEKAWQANDDDSLLFDARVKQYRLGNGIRGYETPGGVCIDLADVIMAFDLPIRLDKKSRRATGWLFEEDRTITIDRDQNAVQIVNSARKLRPGEIYDTPEGWCVSAKSLSDWLAVDVEVDRSNALLLIKSDHKLPFELVEERKARAKRIRPSNQFDLATLPQAREPYKLFRTPSVDAVVSVGGALDRRGRNRADVSYELYASGEIAKASFDARLSSDDKGVPESLRVRAYRSDPEGVCWGLSRPPTQQLATFPAYRPHWWHRARRAAACLSPTVR